MDPPQRIARLRRRNKTDSLVAEPAGKTPFRGNLIVLVNANSASASEPTTRFLQLEGYATVVGDRSAGALMSSIYYPHETGFLLGGKYVNYGVAVSLPAVMLNDNSLLE